MMAKRSVFRDFIAALNKHWTAAFPSIRPLERPLGLLLPKASSYYSGVAKPHGLHVFLNFQHSSKSWQIGQFTINIILSQEQDPHEVRPELLTPEDLDSLREGLYRIGPFLGGKD